MDNKDKTISTPLPEGLAEALDGGACAVLECEDRAGHGVPARSSHRTDLWRVSMAAKKIAEEWRPVKGWEDRYEVSSLGRVRSLCKRGATRVRVTEKNYKGYIYLCLYRGKERSYRSVHSLVLEAFTGQSRPNGMECSHINGVKCDNRPENLEWASSAQNEAMKRLHGTALLGARHHRAIAKLEASDIQPIRDLSAKGVPVRKIARMYGVHRATIKSLIDGKSWAWG